MLDQAWGGAPDARRAGRPVVLSAALGVAAFGLTFCGAFLLGRGLAGAALAALLLPLALSGAVAVGLAVAFVVAVALEQPYGIGRVSRLVAVAAPLAALVALFAYAADPSGRAGQPLAGNARAVEPGAPRAVTVPRAPRTPARTTTVPPAVAAPAPGAGEPAPVLPGPVAPGPDVPDPADTAVTPGRAAGRGPARFTPSVGLAPFAVPGSVEVPGGKAKKKHVRAKPRGHRHKHPHRVR